MQQLSKRIAALEQRGAPSVIFIQFDRNMPGPRQLADGQAVDPATFAQRLASAGPAAVVIKVQYGTTR